MSTSQPHGHAVVPDGVFARDPGGSVGSCTLGDPGARYDAGGQVHPNQKPLPLVRALLEAFSEPGELVLDPFAGAGTTAVACAQLGRRFLGWKIDPKYHAIATERLGGSREQMRLEVG